jgi:hypothetical protein
MANKQQATENMETHAHHLHEAPGHGWKHYFFEFLMMFLAVTLGFLAENQRESYVERHREKQFARLLYVDLKRDSQEMDEIIDIKKWRAQKIDSLFYFLLLPNLQENAKPIYYYRSYLDINVPFKPNDATIQQLRSSGGLRYFHNLKLYNSITKYYSDCSSYYDNEPSSTATILAVEGPTVKIFGADELYSIKSITPSIKDAVKYPTENMQLLTTDKLVINEFKHSAKILQIDNDISLLLLGRIHKELNGLINDLKKEYHPENE